MATNKLTRHKSGITILTEDFTNSLYGGLYGKPEGASLDPYDPLVAGHIHDGQHLDGHAQKINLSEHTVGELDGSSIKDASIPLSKLEVGVAADFSKLLLTNDGRLIVDNDGIILLQ